MDLEIGPRYEEFRQEVRDFLDRHRDAAPPAGVGAMRDARVLAWQKTLIEHGYAARTIPTEYGGYGAEPDILKSQSSPRSSARRRAGGLVSQGISMFVPTLLELGTEEQKSS